VLSTPCLGFHHLRVSLPTTALERLGASTKQLLVAATETVYSRYLDADVRVGLESSHSVKYTDTPATAHTNQLHHTAEI